MAAGWLCRHLFEHYEYTLDRGFLKYRAYPAIRDAAIFYIDMLSEDEDGYLVMSPTTSPENAFIYEGEIRKVSKTATMTIAIVKEVFSNFLKCCEALNIDDELNSEIKDKLSKLYPYKVGSKGQLLEWEEEFVEPEPHHRHISHIYPLHPGTEITHLDTPELAEACRRSLDLRGDDGTGWSLGWKINTWRHAFGYGIDQAYFTSFGQTVHIWFIGTLEGGFITQLRHGYIGHPVPQDYYVFHLNHSLTIIYFYENHLKAIPNSISKPLGLSIGIIGHS
jgi:hypothetical protein